jgi:hypothetical protein
MERSVNQDHKTRLGGLFFILGGAVLGYLSIWRPYREAVAGSQTLSLNRSGIGLSILLPLMGIVLVVGGETAMNHLKAQTVGKKTKLGWLYLIVIGAIALGVYYAVQQKFEAMGYAA